MGKVFEKLETIYNVTGCCCTVDSEFAQNNYPFLIKSSKHHSIWCWKRFRFQGKQPQYTSWMCQASFPGTKDDTLFECKGQWKLMIKLMLLLFNFHVRKSELIKYWIFTWHHCQRISMRLTVVIVVNKSLIIISSVPK